jgi:hypothetical protein
MSKDYKICTFGKLIARHMFTNSFKKCKFFFEILRSGLATLVL